MRRNNTILGSTLLLAAILLTSSSDVRADATGACTLLPIRAHQGNSGPNFNFCISVTLNPDTSELSGINIDGPMEKAHARLDEINKGISIIPIPTNPLRLIGQNLTPDSGGRVSLNYLKTGGGRGEIDFELTRSGPNWVVRKDDQQVALADIDVVIKDLFKGELSVNDVKFIYVR